MVSKEIVVRLGEWDVQSTKENLPHQDIRIDHVVIHPRFNPDSLAHNIALLFLKVIAFKSSKGLNAL